VKFENQLRISAIHIADREVLYYLLKENASPEVGNEEIKHDRGTAEETVYESQQTVIESAKNSDYLISEIEKDSIDSQIEKRTDNFSIALGHSILISSESENEDSPGVMLFADEETSGNEDKIFFMDPAFSVPDQTDLLELDLDENRKEISGEDEANNAVINTGEKSSEKQLQSELIDRFIIANPRIEPVKGKASLQIEEDSKPVIEEDGGFVTETLAKIYLNQGYYSKAIDIYEKLSLKFPEKNSYFASQIEKVKEYIKK
jgi:hypothetical protein